MAIRVFISFRFSDGFQYKEDLCSLFKDSDDVIDCSENEDRSSLSEDTIKKYLYTKLSSTSVTIVILTPDALEYERDIWSGKIDDWMYDELRYSLEDREDNRTNGIIAVYTEEVEKLLFVKKKHKCNVCNREQEVIFLHEAKNLVRNNMMNVKNQYKKNPCPGLFDGLEDSYVSLVKYSDFIKDIDSYINNAVNKRGRKDEFDLVIHLQ